MRWDRWRMKWWKCSIQSNRLIQQLHWSYWFIHSYNNLRRRFSWCANRSDLISTHHDDESIFSLILLRTYGWSNMVSVSRSWVFSCMICKSWLLNRYGNWTHMITPRSESSSDHVFHRRISSDWAIVWVGHVGTYSHHHCGHMWCRFFLNVSEIMRLGEDDIVCTEHLILTSSRESGTLDVFATPQVRCSQFISKNMRTWYRISEQILLWIHPEMITIILTSVISWRLCWRRLDGLTIKFNSHFVN